jgi:hypothetical protein
MLGVRTIGNATLVAYDGSPVLATDPWFDASGAYFGSWGLSHDVPASLVENIRSCPYVWLSHGHPDHLDLASLEGMRSSVVLLPDHVGKRIHDELVQQGFRVRILKDRQWVSLSKHIRVLCISDYNQDGVLLVDVAGRLFVNLNDASDRGWGRWVRQVIRGYRESYLLKLCGRGDADMINFFDEDGQRVAPPAARSAPVGLKLARQAELYGVSHVVPFSSFHRYQREDSIWANEYVTPLEAYGQGFTSRSATLLPAFVEVDGSSGSVRQLDPEEKSRSVRSPADFGDVWSDELEREDVVLAKAYFTGKELLRRHFGFIRLKVGGRETVISLEGKLSRGITFEAPRASLVTAMRHEIFDDLLIGNFVRTTLHDGNSLYPKFTPVVAKYADNGRACSKADVRGYFFEYWRRSPAALLMHALEKAAHGSIRPLFSKDGAAYDVARRVYVGLKHFG